MHFLYLHSNFRKAEPQCHLPLVGSPSHRSKSSHQLSIPKPSEALPFPRQLDSAASNDTRAQPVKQDARQCGGLPASVRDLRQEHLQSDNAHRVPAPNISRKLFPDPDPAPAPMCAVRSEEHTSELQSRNDI